MPTARPRVLSAPVSGVRLSLWRAACVFRVVGLAVCVFLIVLWQPIYRRPSIAVLAAVGMAVVTAAVLVLGWRGYAHRRGFVLADAVVTLGLTLLSIPAQTATQQHGGMVTLTTIWAAGPTVEAAFVAGPFGGLAVGAVQYAVAAGIAQQWDGRTLYSGVLLLVTGAVVGFVVQLATRAEDDLRVAEATRAATAERERIARSIHDGVLQVLALVHRAGARADGEWAQLAAAAAEQETALRGLLAWQDAPAPRDGMCDLATDLRGLAGPRVTVAAPGEPVLLDAQVAEEVVAAVRAALHNVVMHAGDGARAWVLLDALEAELHVCVRDDGAGMAPDRLDTAARDGRLGVARSIRGRVTELRGTVDITSAPARGTEVRMVIPR
ncbi:MacS family sensor histidine kinase [uncultured Jatrophihabitans sp.]|uniref:MacS family sensor histidine kinase n=1 Tax=uncultured Jatrophihabitans sp. TaxID=1610747 RepID=UPI0035CA6F6A